MKRKGIINRFKNKSTSILIEVDLLAGYPNSRTGIQQVLLVREV
jgi:glycerol-3-phosphate responsive antiterminator